MTRTKQPAIPIHQMSTQALLGIEFRYMDVNDEYDEIMQKSHKNMIHRDSYYSFAFMDTAKALFTIDFEEMQVAKRSVLYIRPGQVHFVSSLQRTKGWHLAIDPMLVEDSYKSMFEEQFATQKPIALSVPVAARMRSTAHLLHNAMQAKPTVFSSRITLSLASVFIGIIAEQYLSQQADAQQRESRSALIAYRFKKLLSENFKTLKSPAQYAKALSYSLSHLNESVKSTSGFPVSYWIHQQGVLEAKRLLCYTSMDVREIAFALGYEDHTYFSRLFSKVVGMSPSAFRYKFHE